MESELVFYAVMGLSLVMFVFSIIARVKGWSTDD